MEESDSDENDPFHDNDDDRDRCYIPEIDCSDEEPKNEVEVAIQIDEEDDVEDALNDLGSGVEDLSVECDAVIDEATATPIDRRPRHREVQEGPLRGKKVPAHLFPPDIEPEVPNESFVYAKDGTCWYFEEPPKALFVFLKTSEIKSEVKSNPRIPIVDGPGVDDQRLPYLELKIDQVKLTITGDDCAQAVSF
ncbi:hypothetical protein FQA39_LY17590 [Lamprigera yunnana]|nr:hypothetical protein FQA39_LY17590 [Lamprigera yunnana]